MTLEEFRIANELTLDTLAERLGIGGQNPARTVQRYVRHERIPPRPMMRRIEEITAGRVTPDDFPDRSVVRQSASEAA